MKDTHLYFFYQNIIFFPLKRDIYYALIFQGLKILFKMQVGISTEIAKLDRKKHFIGNH